MKCPKCGAKSILLYNNVELDNTTQHNKKATIKAGCFVCKHKFEVEK